MSAFEQKLKLSGAGQKRKAGQLVSALDLGATKIVCLIGEYDDAGRVQLVGHGQQSSRGLKGGTVIDMDGLERSIRLAVEDAERMAGQSITDIQIAVSGPALTTTHVGGDIAMSGREIGPKDVSKLLHATLDKAQDEKFHILHAVPLSYAIDGNDGVRDPRGMFADRLAVGMSIVRMPTPVYKNLTLCVSRAHLSVTGLSAGPYMSADAVLVDDERDNGAICVDLGGGSTGIAVFCQGVLAHLEALPVGGYHVTSDLAQGLGTTQPAAERVKTLHASLLTGQGNKHERVDTPKIGDDGRLQAAQTPRHEIETYIRPRVEEIFELVAKRLKASGLGGMLPNRVVLTGGGSELPGIREVAARVLGMPVRLGRPQNAEGLGEICQRPTFSTASGLLTFDQAEGRPPSPKGRVTERFSGQDQEQGLVMKAFDWLKENF